MKHIIIDSINSPLFKEVYDIIDGNFPHTEKRTYHDHINAFKKFKNFIIEALADDNNKITGMLTWWEFDDCIYGEHLAIVDGYKGQGYGKIMQGRMQSIADSFEKPIIFEIEPPCSSPQAKRRLDFYLRGGFVFNEHIKHFQPTYNAGDTPLEMNIMSYPVAITIEEYNKFKKQQTEVIESILKDSDYKAIHSNFNDNRAL